MEEKTVKKLSQLSQEIEKTFEPNTNFDKVIERERNESWKYGGRTVFGKATKPLPPQNGEQLKLF